MAFLFRTRSSAASVLPVVAKLLRSASHDEGRSVVIVSHDPRLKDIADRVLWLEDGRFHSVSEMSVDPVCGMAVEREGEVHYRYEGETFYFCSIGCRDEFLEAPDRFAPGDAIPSMSFPRGKDSR